MDRLSKVHRSSRVQLPRSIVNFDNADKSAASPSRSLPIVPRYIGIILFLTCGFAVIAAASLLALNV